ncbi:hypothetical protein PT974_00895 [Cladobotryum mycophilum]|uniref:Myb-like domain-containing protein n=1 Tax=Cladobotryum mycophilum TaxID=491253 RepID=A0ABR0T258_9HYPO
MDATPEGKVLAWTEEAKYQFLLRIIAQLKEDGRPIRWERINMPGRTTKSLQNMWTKIKKAVDEIEKETASGTPAKTSAKKASSRGRPKKSILVQQDDDVDDDEEDNFAPIPLKLPKKRGYQGDDGSHAKRMKREEEYNEFARAIKNEDSTFEGLFSSY